jgi:hypothetical protein
VLDPSSFYFAYLSANETCDTAVLHARHLRAQARNHQDWASGAAIVWSEFPSQAFA